MSHFRKILISVWNLPELTLYVQYIHHVCNRLNEVSEIEPYTNVSIFDWCKTIFIHYLINVREYKISRWWIKFQIDIVQRNGNGLKIDLKSNIKWQVFLCVNKRPRRIECRILSDKCHTIRSKIDTDDGWMAKNHRLIKI